MPSRIHVIGSMVVDRIVRVPSLPRPGETVLAHGEAVAPGGKGANQAVAAARCGASVRMHGRTGREGQAVVEALAAAGVDVRGIVASDPVSGSATVLVADGGENAIAVLAGANRLVNGPDVARFLRDALPGELSLFQNECSALAEGIEASLARGLRTWLNAAPADPGLAALPLERLDGIIVNEIEADALTGCPDPMDALAALGSRMPASTVVVTLGEKGAVAMAAGRRHAHGGYPVRAVDTVGCGDAFTGSFLAAVAEGLAPQAALGRGNAAGALAATRQGAIPSLPDRESVLALAATPGRDAALDSRA